MTLIRITAGALMLTVLSAGAMTIQPATTGARTASAADVALTLLGASTAAEARMCDPACPRWRCC